MAKASGRRRQNKVASLTIDGVVTSDQVLLTKHITDYCKQLFGSRPSFNFDVNFNFSRVVGVEENRRLLDAFTLDEIKIVVFSMEKNKAPGPDGFPIEFFQRFWDIIKFSLKRLFDDLMSGVPDVNRLNYGIITLVPKVPEADVIQKFRPICLLNVGLKILTKASNNRLTSLANDILDATQTAFIKGRFILDGAVVLHEILNELHHNHGTGVVFKVDFEKHMTRLIGAS